MAVLTNVGMLAILDAGTAGLTNPRIGLFTDDIEVSEDSVKADFTLAAYTGYAAVTPTISAPYQDQPTGDIAFALSQAVFTGPTSGDGADVYGWLLYDGTSGDLFAAGSFGEPKSLQEALSRVTVDVSILMNGNADVAVGT